MTIHRMIQKYRLNPGPADVKLIIGALLAISSPVYGVGQSGNHYNITKMETDENGVKLSSAKWAGNMWLEGPQILCLDSYDENVIDTVKNTRGVSFLEEYRQVI